MALDVEALYRKYGPMVLRRCRRLLGNEEKALDAMQDSFVKLLRYEDHLTPSSSLLYRIATNICLNILRSEKRKPTDHHEALLLKIASAEDHVGLTLVRDEIDTLFSREKASTRTIAVLHYVDQLTLEETAAQVGLSVSGVRKRLKTLRARGLALKGDE